ncbi:hypothetical protein SAMN05421827_12073 [Pedobacter terrae]|uniref:Uncharacterized protein n=1 Tax=Pedobacter terrae TaxID=405671 RepID=A0A1G8AZY7_9SPHI|nr:hypothetical protein SAMN05421827_12073 [Pedobacter terrae]
MMKEKVLIKKNLITKHLKNSKVKIVGYTY